MTGLSITHHAIDVVLKSSFSTLSVTKRVRSPLGRMVRFVMFYILKLESVVVKHWWGIGRTF